LPASVTKIRAWAFSSNKIKHFIVLNDAAKFSSSNALKNNDPDLTIYVYDSSSSKQFANDNNILFSSINGVDLSNLELNPGVISPDFTVDIQTYTATVDYDVTSIEITPTAKGNTTVKVNGDVVTSGAAHTVDNLEA